MSVKCDEPSAGRFILRAATGCLTLGAPTMVFTEPAFSTELSTDCDTSRAQWDLTPSVAGSFTLRNVESELSLDVRAFSDLPGTPVILFGPNTLDNQRFFVRPRAAGAYELAPRHAPGLCAEARGGAVEIWPCDSSLDDQSFRFSRSTCP